jgi:hypothetical protein
MMIKSLQYDAIVYRFIFVGGFKQSFSAHKVFNSSHFARNPLCYLLFRPFPLLSSPTPIGSVFQGMLKG